MLQLSGALLANMDVRKLLSAISASIAGGGADGLPRRWDSTKKAADSIMVQFLDVSEKQPDRGDVRVAVARFARGPGLPDTGTNLRRTYRDS